MTGSGGRRRRRCSQRAPSGLYGFDPAEDEDVATYGVADAVAIDEMGSIDTVVDWKSDIAADAGTVAAYTGQLARYLELTGGRRGLQVFVSSGEILSIELPNWIDCASNIQSAKASFEIIERGFGRPSRG